MFQSLSQGLGRILGLISALQRILGSKLLDDTCVSIVSIKTFLYPIKTLLFGGCLLILRGV